MALAAFGAAGLGLAAPVLAQEGLRTGYGVGGPLLAPLPEPVDVADPDFGYPLGQAPVGVNEPLAAPFDINWSLGLRGAYTKNERRDYYEALAIPKVDFRHDGVRGDVSLGASAEIVKPSNDELALRSFNVTGAADYQLDPSTQIKGDAAFIITQPRRDDPSLASDILDPPVEISGTGNASITRQFGRLGTELRGSVTREVYGDTTLVDGTVLDNRPSNRSEVGGGLRISYKLTPILTPFIDGEASRDFYDAPSPALGGVYSDGLNYALRTGVTGQWGETLTAEASVGWGWRDFAAGELEDVDTTLYDARLTYRPTRSLTLGAQFSTAFQPPGPDRGGTTRVEYVAQGDVAYRVNDWLGLRALANWTYAEIAPLGAIERGHGFGVGADYLVNRHASVNADYGYSHSETVNNPATDSHRVTLGLTLQK